MVKDENQSNLVQFTNFHEDENQSKLVQFTHFHKSSRDINARIVAHLFLVTRLAFVFLFVLKIKTVLAS